MKKDPLGNYLSRIGATAQGGSHRGNGGGITLFNI